MRVPLIAVALVALAVGQAPAQCPGGRCPGYAPAYAPSGYAVPTYAPQSFRAPDGDVRGRASYRLDVDYEVSPRLYRVYDGPPSGPVYVRESRTPAPAPAPAVRYYDPPLRIDASSYPVGGGVRRDVRIIDGGGPCGPGGCPNRPSPGPVYYR